MAIAKAPNYSNTVEYNEPNLSNVSSFFVDYVPVFSYCISFFEILILERLWFVKANFIAVKSKQNIKNINCSIDYFRNTAQSLISRSHGFLEILLSVVRRFSLDTKSIIFFQTEVSYPCFVLYCIRFNKMSVNNITKLRMYLSNAVAKAIRRLKIRQILVAKFGNDL